MSNAGGFRKAVMEEENAVCRWVSSMDSLSRTTGSATDLLDRQKEAARQREKWLSQDGRVDVGKEIRES